jgi:hypothetical protein
MTMLPTTSAPGTGDRRPRRRGTPRRCTLWALSLAWLTAVAACASPPPAPGEAPLAIGYVWPEQAEPLETSTVSVGPSQVLIRWHPDKYAVADIQTVADQQCAAFRRTAHPIAPPEPSPPLLLQRFACVAGR